jgi:hypothetical protein
MTDLTSGLPPEREQVAQSEPEMPFWAENMMFALYDPTSEVGAMLHLGTRPDEWTMWHDQAYVMLPPDLFGTEDGGVAWMWAYHRTAPERRPGGSNITFRCVEPFRRWHIAFDGVMLMTPNDEMTTGLAREGAQQRVVIDLDIQMVAPAFDLAVAAQQPTARGTWESQGWANSHYQQLYRADGTLRVADTEVEFHGFGWRDHSQGARGAGPQPDKAPWGGHCTAGAVYPDSGRAWSYSRYFTPDGVISLDAGYVVDEAGAFHHARILEAPRLSELELVGEELPVVLEWDGGRLETVIETRRSLWMAMRMHMVVGLDLDGPGMVYVINHGPAEWDGEVGTTYVERSDMQNQFAPDLRDPD